MDAKQIAIAAIEHCIFCDGEILSEYYGSPDGYFKQVLGCTVKDVEEALDCKFYFGEVWQHTFYKCKACGQTIDFYTVDFDDVGEEELWGHIQMHHEDKFEEVQNWETPDMIEECYEEEM